MLKTLITSTLLSLLLAAPIQAAQYQLDPTHTFVVFRVKHLGYSWLYGRFNHIKGTLTYDSTEANQSSINVEIDTTSLDTGHAERDKHLRNAKFLDVKKYPAAYFKSTSFSVTEDGGLLKGNLTFHGITKPISINVIKIGEGKDPWGGYRVGFSGKLDLMRSDFGVSYNLGPASEVVELELGIEGIRINNLMPQSSSK